MTIENLDFEDTETNQNKLYDKDVQHCIFICAGECV